VRFIIMAPVLGIVFTCVAEAQDERAGSTSVPRSSIETASPAKGVGEPGMAGSSTARREPVSPLSAVEKPGPPGTKILELERVSFQIPDSWKNVPPSSRLRLAEIVIPRDPHDADDGRLGVFYLGPRAGGTEANIARWYGQVSQPDGTPTERIAKRETFQASGLKVTFVDVGGTLDMGVSTDRSERKGCRLLGAIVETPSGPWFFKATGPDKTMVKARPLLRNLLTTFRVK